MKVMVIPIVDGALGTVIKGLKGRLAESEIIERSEIIQTTVLLRSVRMLWIVLEICGDLLLLSLQWEATS